MLTRIPVYLFDDKYIDDTDGFTFNLSAWLGDTDQIQGTPTATITPAGIATVISVVASGSFVTVWISGGGVGVRHTVEIHVETVGGRNCRVRGQFKAES